MAALETPQANIGWQAADFNLKGIDGKSYNLQDARGPNGLVVMFICNHCPFVQAIADKIARDMADLAALGIGSIAIMSNDTVNYPEDSFDNMKRWAREKRFPFPYALDDTQKIAKAYGAVCTPDFFGFNARFELQYRGRIDATSPSNPALGAPRELFDAMVHVAKTGAAPKAQQGSIGCSIKWKTEG